MSKTVHVVSNAAGVILKASEDKAVCDAFISGRLLDATHILEPWQTPSGDPATLYKVPNEDANPNAEPFRLAYVLTTLRLT